MSEASFDTYEAPYDTIARRPETCKSITGLYFTWGRVKLIVPSTLYQAQVDQVQMRNKREPKGSECLEGEKQNKPLICIVASTIIIPLSSLQELYANIRACNILC